ncbi:MAG: sodium-dependent transporter [Candidatus Marinimicrobia bacterium]|nr:sodium-dependent transporter [Candidatus Neomarinimicrobiota bacterium]
MTSNREHWGSRAGFILAAAGSAVGLGNIWKYPHMAGQHGGAAFTMVYLLCILVVGLPILLAELSIGRRTQLNPVGGFSLLSNNSNWKWVGFLGVASAFTILSFYSVVGGWTIKYTVLALTGSFGKFSATGAAGDFFDAFVKNPVEPVFWHLVFMGLCVFIIDRGVKAGIERWSKVLMPVLLGILVLLVFRGVTLDGAGAGLRFLFSPKWGDLDASGVVLALGHSFFTISLGMGTMITYGSYLRRESDLIQSALWIVALDTFIALMAGIAIFTAVFALGQNPAEGPGLIFVVLPSLFPHMPGGQFFAALFFFLLFVAALTSAISILEVVTAYFIDEKGWSRTRATNTFGAIIAFIGVLASLSNGNYNVLSPVTDLTFMDLLDKASSKYMLPLGGMLTAVFVLTRWGVDHFRDEIKSGAKWFQLNKQVITIIFVIASLVVAYIFASELVALFR